ncbi:nitrilase-related carbon-nitrogen hydrolase [Tundrisphaera sp. TA3]|uniref:nitrilase-related carbon-nitrogen hydrolase n=1 Tax=Tundrisphaera sp. TA3 TaxID=3435775 RepID=UPI003EB82C2D
MSAPGRYYAAACQTDRPCLRDRSEIPGRVDDLLAMVDNAVVGYGPFFDVRLVVFPEFAHTAPIYPTLDEIRDRLAVPIPNEFTDRYRRKARQHGVFIQTGTFLEVDPAWPGAVFNTTCLIGPDGLLSRYRKVYPWLPWELHTSPHDLPGYEDPMFPVVETEIGRLGAAICYDWLFPEAIRALAQAGAEVLLRVSAYMDPWGATPPMDWWTLFNRARAVENFAYVVAANQGASLAHYPPFSWPGGSMIVDFDGRILAQADPGPGEKIVVAPIDLAALRQERARRRGHAFLDHLRTEANRGTFSARPLPDRGSTP